MNLWLSAVKVWRVGPLRTVGMVVRYVAQVALNPRIQADSFVKIQPRARLFVPKGATLRVGKNALIKNDAIILVNPGGHLSLGDHVSLGHHGEITVGGTVAIGSDTHLGPYAYVTDTNHTFEDLDVPWLSQPLQVQPTSIGRDVWIGRAALVLPGAQVADHCVVGAGAIVTKVHAAGDIIVGTAARTVRNRYASSE